VALVKGVLDDDNSELTGFPELAGPFGLEFVLPFGINISF
jgi:hypothetical protein